jgi:hypothetical protein
VKFRREPLPEPPEHVAAMLREARIEEALAELRRLGFLTLQSILILHQVTGMSLTEGKRIVFSSETWRDLRADREAFEAEVEEAVQHLIDDLEAGRTPNDA